MTDLCSVPALASCALSFLAAAGAASASVCCYRGWARPVTAQTRCPSSCCGTEAGAHPRWTVDPAPSVPTSGCSRCFSPAPSAWHTAAEPARTWKKKYKWFNIFFFNNVCIIHTTFWITNFLSDFNLSFFVYKPKVAIDVESLHVICYYLLLFCWGKKIAKLLMYFLFSVII